MASHECRATGASASPPPRSRILRSSASNVNEHRYCTNAAPDQAIIVVHGERLRVARDASHVRVLQRDVEELRRAATRRRGDRLRLGRWNFWVCAGAHLGWVALRGVVRARLRYLRQRAPLLSRPRDARGGEFAIGAPPRPLVRATLSTRAIYTQAFSLPPWPEDKSPWRYLLRCRSSSLQDLSSSGTLLY